MNDYSQAATSVRNQVLFELDQTLNDYGEDHVLPPRDVGTDVHLSEAL